MVVVIKLKQLLLDGLCCHGYNKSMDLLLFLHHTSDLNVLQIWSYNIVLMCSFSMNL